LQNVSEILIFLCIPNAQVVHPHLRFVLIVQSAATVLAAIAVSVIVINEFLVGDPLARLSPQFYAVYTFLYSFTAMLGHVLLLERVLATVMAHRYEQWRSPWFSAGWCILLVSEDFTYNLLKLTNIKIYDSFIKICYRISSN
jgi:hypothetical protein